MSYALDPIGVVHSCFKEKFGIPRQPGLVPSSLATIELYPPFQDPSAFNEIEQFSHLWIIFIFHGVPTKQWHPTVRPPKLGGNHRVGVFASRSPFRPNPIGLSTVKNLGVEKKNGSLFLRVQGGDFLEGTPVLDIKPYHVGADCLPEATMGYAGKPWQAERLVVVFSSLAEEEIAIYEKEQFPHLRDLVIQVLSLDPRPGYCDDEGKQFGLTLYDLNILWKIEGRQVFVLSVKKN